MVEGVGCGCVMVYSVGYYSSITISSWNCHYLLLLSVHVCVRLSRTKKLSRLYLNPLSILSHFLIMSMCITLSVFGAVCLLPTCLSHLCAKISYIFHSPSYPSILLLHCNGTIQVYSVTFFFNLFDLQLYYTTITCVYT